MQCPDLCLCVSLALWKGKELKRELKIKRELKRELKRGSKRESKGEILRASKRESKGGSRERAQEKEFKSENSRERAQEKKLNRGRSEEPCPVGACLFVWSCYSGPYARSCSEVSNRS